jgi:hypothetical protein
VPAGKRPGAVALVGEQAPARALRSLPGWTSRDSSALALTDGSVRDRAVVSPIAAALLLFEQTSHDKDAGAPVGGYRSRTKAAARAPAPMRTPRAIPIVRHGATACHTGAIAAGPIRPKAPTVRRVKTLHTAYRVTDLAVSLDF